MLYFILKKLKLGNSTKYLTIYYIQKNQKIDIKLTNRQIFTDQYYVHIENTNRYNSTDQNNQNIDIKLTNRQMFTDQYYVHIENTNRYDSTDQNNQNKDNKLLIGKHLPIRVKLFINFQSFITNRQNTTDQLKSIV